VIVEFVASSDNTRLTFFPRLFFWAPLLSYMKREAITDGRGGRGAGCSQQKTSRGTASSATAKATLQTFGKTHENCCNCEVLDLT